MKIPGVREQVVRFCCITSNVFDGSGWVTLAVIFALLFSSLILRILYS